MEKKYPMKLELRLTQACHDLHVSESILDVQAVVSDLEIFEEHNYKIPEWLDAWIQLSMKNPILTGQEQYKMRLSNMFPDPSELEDPADIKSFANEKHETQKLQHAIHYANCFSPSAKEDCAFMIAARMLWNPSGGGGALAFEWHCGLDYYISLDERNNFNLLVKILRRETEFWHDDMKPNSWKIPKLQPMRNT